jgi:hypothetical protein
VDAAAVWWRACEGVTLWRMSAVRATAGPKRDTS